MGFLLNIIDSGDFLQFPFAAWRFLLSKKNRKSLRDKWSQQQRIETIRDQIGLFLGFLFTIIIVGLALIFLI